MFYTPKHFSIQEMVNPTTFATFGELAWMFFDPRFLRSMDLVRDHFGRPVYMNNWDSGGNLTQRGLRINSNIGASYSLHKFGCAGDYDVKGLHPDEVRKEILSKKDSESFKLINCIEEGITWNHHDCRNILNRVLIVRP